MEFSTVNGSVLDLRYSLTAQGLGGHSNIGNSGNYVEFLICLWLHTWIVLSSNILSSIDECKDTASFVDHAKGSENWPGWHHELRASVASDSIYYVLSL